MSLFYEMYAMKKQPRKKSLVKNISRKSATIPLESQFAEVAGIIAAGRRRALTQVNAATVDTYWNVGRYICEKIRSAQWGQGVVQGLAEYLYSKLPDVKGFSDKNLWRMKQFFETYEHDIKLSPLVRELGWTQNLIILSGAKSSQEREFYLLLAINEHCTKRELERQLQSGLFERCASSKPKVSTVLTQIHPAITTIIRDSYSLAFLGLPNNHSESDLRRGIVHSLKEFIVEFGRDFAFIAQEYRVQVGMKDFFIDLLFYHRELQCLVAFELKIDEFKPEYLGKTSFYLEALDRDVKKTHENPSIGIILCKGKDAEVVEYALSRTLSPAAIADYTTKLPDKKLLQDKLHEFFDCSVRELQAEYR